MKYALHLHSRGRDFYLMKSTASLANREIRHFASYPGKRGRQAKLGVRFTTDKRRAMPFASVAAAEARWRRLSVLHDVRGWVVLPVLHPVNRVPKVRKNPTGKASSLWSYNAITGYWKHERGVTSENAAEWLRVYQSDSPDKHFKISTSKPKHSPFTKKGNFRKGVRSNPHKAGSADKQAAKELRLFIESEPRFDAMKAAVLRNLEKKFRAGQYSVTKAAKLWKNLIEAGARGYADEYLVTRDGPRNSSLKIASRVFSAATRRLVARSMASFHYAEMKAGNFQVSGRH